jgi:P4 family phage/plasmid primase-like protien
LIGFLQRMAGYCLTGSIRDHALFFVHGPGGNGKGTFLNTLTWILGDYAGVAAMDTFTEQHQPQHKTELASLMGRRLVSAQEVEEGKRWAEARINALTGGDPITANFMRHDLFTFMPQFKLIVVGNHKPIFRNVGDAIRRRLHLVPFTHKIEEKDKDSQLPDKLRAEAGGILRWAVAGCIEWQRGGLRPPAIVLSATDDYLSSQDTIGTWLEEVCDTGAGFSEQVSVIFGKYRDWCEQNGEQVLGRKRFVEAMTTRGYPSNPYRGTYRIAGVRVRS